MTSRSAPTTRPGRAKPVESAVVCDDRAVLQALESACHLHEGPVTVLELVWAWAADLWWDAITDLQIDAMALPHTPSRADLARVRRRLTALRDHGLATCSGTPSRWQPIDESCVASSSARDDKVRPSAKADRVVRQDR
jgi:hypothetical protein